MCVGGGASEALLALTLLTNVVTNEKNGREIARIPLEWPTIFSGKVNIDITRGQKMATFLHLSAIL